MQKINELYAVYMKQVLSTGIPEWAIHMVEGGVLILVLQLIF